MNSLSTGENFTYDANGNTPHCTVLRSLQCGASVTTRVEAGVTYTQTFDADREASPKCNGGENRLVSMTASGQTIQFLYDGLQIEAQTG